jgi:Uma2 family endonuclease
MGRIDAAAEVKAMSTASKLTSVTFDEFCFLVKDGQKADLIDGVIYMASPDNTDANSLNAWLCSLMTIYAREKDLGNVYVSRVAFRLDDTNSPEPDIGFIRKDRLHQVKRGRIDGPPDLAVEIVSPDSVERDYDKKRNQYERFGVGEYWIVDELESKITLLRLQQHGGYEEVRPEKGLLHSHVMPGFYLDPQWCWQAPLPKELGLLREMLSEER